MFFQYASDIVFLIALVCVIKLLILSLEKTSLQAKLLSIYEGEIIIGEVTVTAYLKLLLIFPWLIG